MSGRLTSRPRSSSARPDAAPVEKVRSCLESVRSVSLGGKRELLKERFGIVVMTAEETVQHLATTHGWET